jgi:hypothetical protein
MHRVCVRCDRHPGEEGVHNFLHNADVLEKTR